MENEILNFSMAEEDPFADINQDKSNITEVVNEWNTWQPTTLQRIVNYAYIVLFLTKFFLDIAVVLTDILIVYLILRYKRLRKNFNLYILHYAVMNSSYYVIAPILLIAHLLLSIGFKSFFHVYCYMRMLEGAFLFMSILFAITLGIDWTISYYKPHYLRQIQVACKRKFVIFYVLLVLLSTINCLLCNVGFHLFTPELLFYSMPFFIIVLLGMHYIRKRKTLSNEHLKTEHYLWICTIAVGLYIPEYVVHVLSLILDSTSHMEITMAILFLFEQVCSFCSAITPIYILIYLMKWDKHVRMAFDITFRKTVRSYGSDNLDDASDNEEIIEEDVEKNTQRVTNGAGTQDIMVP